MKELYYLFGKNEDKIELCLMLDNPGDNQQLFEWNFEALETIKTILKDDTKVLYSYDLKTSSKWISNFIKDKIQITQLLLKTEDIKTLVLKQNVEFQTNILEKYGIKPSFSKKEDMSLDIKCQLISILKSNIKT